MVLKFKMFGDTNLISQNFKKHGSTNVVFNVEAMDLVFSPEVFEISCIDGGNRSTRKNNRLAASH